MDLNESLTFIADRSGDDDDRIQRIKDLLIDSETLSPDDTRLIGATLAAIIDDENEDVVLRQHAANEIGFYWDEPTESLKARFFDPREDEDIRYNLQASFKDFLPLEALNP